MIEKIDHTNSGAAAKIRTVFQVSYAVEAALLKAIDFPPLQRRLSEFIDSENEFYGYWVRGKLAAVTEIKMEGASTHIQSLVVDPLFFRQGIASKLLTFVFETYQTDWYTVETGLDNVPATQLYLKFGFKEVKVFNTEIGIKKIRFERKA